MMCKRINNERVSSTPYVRIDRNRIWINAIASSFIDGKTEKVDLYYDDDLVRIFIFPNNENGEYKLSRYSKYGTGNHLAVCSYGFISNHPEIDTSKKYKAEKFNNGIVFNVCLNEKEELKCLG